MKNNNSLKKSYVFQKNNFLIGFGSILNIKGSYFNYNYSKTSKEADLKSIYSDWLNVGNDIKVSINKFKSEHNLLICS